MIDLATLKDKLAEPCQIVITTHHKPDGDAMGSSLGLYNYLIQKGHHVKVISPTDYPYFLQWLPNNPEVVIYTEKEEESKKLVAEAELIFCLDFNALSRINELGEEVRKSWAIKIMIDHHLEPEDFDDYRHWSINASSTAELIYDFIANRLNDGNLINKDVATCLYTGIMTDSGSFRFPNVTSNLHRIVADLIDAGAENWRIHQQVYDNTTENRLRFLGFCLTNRLEVFREFNTALISVSKEDLKPYDVQTGDTEGIVNYALSISGIKLAAFIVERSDKVKLSLRSTGTFPANEICKKYFNGGGHRNAAGGASDESFAEVVKKFKSILPEYKNLLLQ
ncbi:MAG: bifunctional oligoribonuclease/PAP phosphatase NrnA [Bacteroidetes bacterium]|nr:bifunctional oligoribonuclease/PAP phosphatase NrnA [Bacteroidota bacterium]MBU1373430.1 bifunctional oligoribonuclease/PAP phosphatase NrnA [Bacteroidota bacterium]MBU1484158.1 bifunctional oligoribonuclease/PAP phosphatase NrnA [Bacteroidota bacterium]MBU1759999.1 bifunctional oligoribonuclease/PAP phosphatase NrnA [Bacteroidota bacterium]MBU2266737.1 bifunctional oligoribonuclease/PAP phosphatase NrnA [Bacteroidota bacterium]